MYGSTIEDGEQLRAKEILINYLSLKVVLGERERQCCDIDVVYPKQSCCIFNFALHIYKVFAHVLLPSCGSRVPDTYVFQSEKKDHFFSPLIQDANPIDSTVPCKSHVDSFDPFAPANSGAAILHQFQRHQREVQLRSRNPRSARIVIVVVVVRPRRPFE